MKAPKKATLEGCYGKVARAEQLIQELDRVNRRFFRRHTPVRDRFTQDCCDSKGCVKKRPMISWTKKSILDVAKG